MSPLMSRFNRASKLVPLVVVVLLLVAAGVTLTSRGSERYLTVDFPQTNSVYEGSDVRILGVAVGKVESLTPRGEVVRAKLSYSSDVKLPADVKAVVISPSIVGDRFVQLAPVYTGGAVLKDGGYLPVSRAAVPVELDQIYQSLDDLSVALGPKGANKNGSFSSLIDDTAKQLDGQGAQLNTTIKNFGKLSTTLANNKDELFGSVRQVDEFVKLLKNNDADVRTFNDSTAQVSTVLEGERDDLAKTLKALSLALIDVNALVKDNRGELRKNVKNLASLSKVLARHQDDLEKLTINGPTALTNIALSYNGNYGTLDTRTNIGELLLGTVKDPASLLCALLGESIENSTCDTLTGLLGTVSGPLTGAASGEPPTLPDLPRSAVPSVPKQAERVNDSIAEMLGADR